jgi:hypothetical protein
MDPVSYVLNPTHQYPPHFCTVISRDHSGYTLRCGAAVSGGGPLYRVGELMPCPACTPVVKDE